MFKYLMDNIDIDFHKINSKLEINALKYLPQSVYLDNSYIDFLHKINGGYFFEKSLHIYGFNHGIEYHDIVKKNMVLSDKYSDLVKEIFFFAEDIFGNQFGYLLTGGICFFNIESSEIDIIANDFEDWLSKLSLELDYYTGRKILQQWNETHNSKRIDFYLCPIRPFVIGGDYDVANLSEMHWIECLGYNSAIAKRINDLPDGTEIDFLVR